MTRYNTPRLLTPPREEEEVYPYRRVWLSIGIELGVLFAVTFAVFIGLAFLGFRLPVGLRQYANLAIALLPPLLWFLFSYGREISVPEPRPRLMSTFIVTALAANAIGIPIINALQVEQWLSLSGSVDRVIGYAFTVGIIQEMLKYLVIRYNVWPEGLRTRLDALAYTAASAIGFVTVINVHLALDRTIATDVIATRVFANTLVHLAASAIVAYGLAEVRFNPRTILLMPSTMLLAAFVQGLGVSVRAVLVNANFALGIAATRPLFGLGFSIAVGAAVLIAVAFMFDTAERQDQEAAASREV